MRQSTLAEAGFQRYSKRTRRERFLEEMERVVPWKALVERCQQRGEKSHFRHDKMSHFLRV